MFKRFFYPAILLYALLVFSAAWPVKTTTALLQLIQNGAIQILSYGAISPGQKLFYRPYRESSKVRGQCVEFFGEDESGKHSLLDSTKISCSAHRGFQIFSDSSEIMIHRLVEMAAFPRTEDARFLGNNAFSDARPANPNERAVYQSLGNFYCHSSLAPSTSKPVKYIYMTWKQEQIDYKTGERKSLYVLFTKWKCDTNQLLFAQWNSFINRAKLEELYHEIP